METAPPDARWPASHGGSSAPNGMDAIMQGVSDEKATNWKDKSSPQPTGQAPGEYWDILFEHKKEVQNLTFVMEQFNKCLDILVPMFNCPEFRSRVSSHSPQDAVLLSTPIPLPGSTMKGPQDMYAACRVQDRTWILYVRRTWILLDGSRFELYNG